MQETRSEILNQWFSLKGNDKEEYLEDTRDSFVGKDEWKKV